MPYKDPKKARAHKRRYRREHHEEIVARAARYYRTHRANALARHRKYRTKFLLYMHRYYRRHRAEAQVKSAHRTARKWKRPGTFTVAEWRALLKATGGRCPLCHKRCPLELHHIIPLREPMSCNWIWNIIPVCVSCHRRLEPSHGVLCATGCAG